MNALSGSILVVLLGVVCFGSRRWALLSLMTGVFFLTQGHSLDVAGLNVWPIRFLEAAAFVRVIARKELTWRSLNRIDWTLLLAYHYGALILILRSSEMTSRMVASAVDPALCYLALRALINGFDDIRWFLNAFVIVLVPFTALVVVEHLTAQNPFMIVGASGEMFFRKGVPRCQGSFRHAILLGSVAAAFSSLYIGMWLGKSHRALPLMGGGLCTLLVVLSNSGGPLTSAATVFLGWSLWLVRTRMALVRRALLALIVFLIIFMQAPIWYLPFKISPLVGGAGYHRGLLMDKAWQDLDKWWLAGMALEQTRSWIPYGHSLFEGADITNQYIVMAIRSGLAGLVMFILVLIFATRAIGGALTSVRQSTRSTRRADECLLWGLGVALIVHAVSWLGVSYFDQSYVVWLMHLAAISAVSQSLRMPATVPTLSPALRGRSLAPVAASGRRGLTKTARPITDFMLSQRHPSRVWRVQAK